MPKPLDAGHFRAPPVPEPSALPGQARLAARLGEACAAGLSSLHQAAWKVTAEGVIEPAALADIEEGLLLRFESERGSLTGFLSLDRAAVSALLEVTMGGSGTEPVFELAHRPLSRIERGVLQLAHDALARQLVQGLSEATALNVNLFTGREAPELDAAGGLVQFRLLVSIFGHSGEISISFARHELERQLGGCAGGQTPGGDALGRDALQLAMGKSEVVVTVTLASETLSLETVAALRPGRHLALSATTATPVIVWSGGVAAYRGSLGRNGDRFAVTVTAAL